MDDWISEFLRGNKTRRYGFVVLVCVLIVLFDGVRFTDPDYPRYFRMLLSASDLSIDPKKGYLLEGLLPDLIGIAYSAAGFKDFTTQVLWWLSGLIVLAAVVGFSIKNRSLSFANAVLIIAFSRVVDTLFVWAGKFDPFLLSFLVMTGNKDRRVALAGIVLAAFSHPIVAVIATVGVVLVQATLRRAWFGAALAAVFVAAGMDAALFHYLFHGLWDRADSLTIWLARNLNSGGQWGLAAAVASLLLPFLYIECFKQPLRLPSNAPAILLALWVGIVVIASSLLTLDHTRVACLLTIAPLIVFLRSQDAPEGDAKVAPGSSTLFFVLLLSRLVIPHFDEYGPHLFWWRL